MTDKVLIIEDEEPVRDLLAAWLDEAGYETCVASNGLEGLREVYQHRPDLVVVDILMPQMDGYEFCKLAREVCEAPIMILTGLGDESKKVKGLNLGADEYVVKPVGMDEFLARVTALLRRRVLVSEPPSAPKRYDDDLLSIDYDRRQVLIRGNTTDFTPTEFKLLWFLTQRMGRTWTPREIIDEVWDSAHYSPDVVKWHISSLRSKIEEDPSNPRYIVTVWGVGYRYERPAVHSSVAGGLRGSRRSS